LRGNEWHVSLAYASE